MTSVNNYMQKDKDQKRENRSQQILQLALKTKVKICDVSMMHNFST